MKEKRKLWKVWQNGEQYLVPKRKAKSTVYAAKKSDQEQTLGNLDSKDSQSYIFKLAHIMKKENQDICGEKRVKYDEGNLTFNDRSELYAWKCP